MKLARLYCNDSRVFISNDSLLITVTFFKFQKVPKKKKGSPKSHISQPLLLAYHKYNNSICVYAVQYVPIFLNYVYHI